MSSGRLVVKYGTREHTFNFDFNSTTLQTLSDSLYEIFKVPNASQKVITKGKLLISNNGTRNLEANLSSLNLIDGSKLSLIGPQESDQSIELEEAIRKKKMASFEFHKQHTKTGVRSTKVHGFGEDDNDKYRFMNIEPFPQQIECYDLRVKMLEKLSKDEAVLDLMRTRKYSVGLLKELHPILQPTLLGLNKNAGEEVSLRLLTDDLEGLRSYKTVRMVLLHELAHNVFGPHDNDFNTLNSIHNKEVAAYEQSHGIGSGEYQVWQPSDTSVEEEEMRRTTHTLNELEVDGGRRKEELKFSEMDEAEMRRERVRIAAEKRRKEEENGK